MARLGQEQQLSIQVDNRFRVISRLKKCVNIVDISLKSIHPENNQ